MAGEDFQKPLQGVMAEACTHLGSIKTSDPQKNLKAMVGQLAILAEHTHPSQPLYRAAVEYAQALLRQHLQGH